MGGLFFKKKWISRYHQPLPMFFSCNIDLLVMPIEGQDVPLVTPNFQLLSPSRAGHGCILDETRSPSNPFY